MRVVSGGHYQRVPVTQHLRSLAHRLSEGHRIVQRLGCMVIVMTVVYATAWMTEKTFSLTSCLPLYNL